MSQNTKFAIASAVMATISTVIGMTLFLAGVKGDPLVFGLSIAAVLLTGALVMEVFMIRIAMKSTRIYKNA